MFEKNVDMHFLYVDMYFLLTCMLKFRMYVDMHSPVCGNTSNNSQYELSLMIITMQYGVVKSFIQWQLGYKVLRD